MLFDFLHAAVMRLFTIAYLLLPIHHSLLPTAYSLFTTAYSLLPHTTCMGSINSKKNPANWRDFVVNVGWLYYFTNLVVISWSPDLSETRYMPLFKSATSNVNAAAFGVARNT